MTGETHYRLVCVGCGARHADDGLMLNCPRPHEPAFLRTEYDETAFQPDPAEAGIYRYRRWLPVRRTFPGAGRTAVYRGERLGRMLGLDNLWIAFSGYWPDRGATLTTGTFKELEAFTVLGRLPPDPPTLVVASAGNTAAAFAWACSLHRIPVLVMIPEHALPALRFPGPLDPCVAVVVHDEPADYSDVIAFADRVARLPGFTAEGGARNVARRDGLATAMLGAVEEMGGLPDHYVQAIGSGAGAIAAHEAAGRLAPPHRRPGLLLCQGLPVAPVHAAWVAGSSDVDSTDRAAGPIIAPELVNRRPPYAIRGGLREALTESGGDVLAADRAAVVEAMATFRSVEGIDVEPPAGVALAALRDHCAAGRMPRDAAVLLHITGGGRAELAADARLVPAEPRLRLGARELRAPDAAESLADRVTHPTDAHPVANTLESR